MNKKEKAQNILLRLIVSEFDTVYHRLDDLLEEDCEDPYQVCQHHLIREMKEIRKELHTAIGRLVHECNEREREEEGKNTKDNK